MKRQTGAPNIQYFKKKVSTVFTNGGLVSIDTNGFLVPATASSINHIGLILQTITATDTDYAVASYVMVDVARATDVFISEVSAGTVAQTAVGAYYDLNSTGDKVDLSATTTKQVFVVEVLVAQSQVLLIVNSTAGVDESGA